MIWWLVTSHFGVIPGLRFWLIPWVIWHYVYWNNFILKPLSNISSLSIKRMLLLTCLGFKEQQEFQLLSCKMLMYWRYILTSIFPRNYNLWYNCQYDFYVNGGVWYWQVLGIQAITVFKMGKHFTNISP